MRILVFVPGGVDPSGSQRIIPALVAYLEQLSRHNEVSVISLKHQPEHLAYDLCGAKVVNLGFAFRNRAMANLPIWLFRLCRFLLANRRPFDLVHSIWFGWSSTLALVTGRLLGVPVVISLGGGELTALPDIRYGGALSWMGRLHVSLGLRFASKVTAGSQYAVMPVRKARPDSLVIPLFPPKGPFTQISTRHDGPAWRLLTVSSVNKVKDPWTLLHALRLVVDEVPEVFLDWVGENLLEKEMMELTKKLDLCDHLQFHGIKPYHEIPHYYHRAHVYIQASRHESQGVAVCEAAFAGLPIVGTRVGTLAELAPQAAIATSPRDHESLAAAVLQVLRNQDLRSKLAGNASLWAANRDARLTARLFEEQFIELCRANG